MGPLDLHTWNSFEERDPSFKICPGRFICGDIKFNQILILLEVVSWYPFHF